MGCQFVSWPSSWVSKSGVIFAVAEQVALPVARAETSVLQPFGDGIRENHRGVEIDEMRVGGGRSLRGADAMSIVANGAGGAVVDDVLAMAAERIVVQDAGSLVAAVAQGIGDGAFAVAVDRVIVRDQQRGEVGTMRAIGSTTAGFGTGVGVVAVGAVDETGGGETGY